MPADGFNAEIKANLVWLCRRMDVVQDFLGDKINIHSVYRPPEYNTLVKGSINSAHLKGMAMDFDVPFWDCDAIRAKLLPKIEDWDLRMENSPGANWIHLDTAPVVNRRFFRP